MLFKSFEYIFNSSFNKLIEVDGINKSLAAKIIQSQNVNEKVLAELENEISLLEKIDVSLISFFDIEYPELLKNIYFPPIFLYLKGNTKIANMPSIAIVGTREPSIYGKQIAESFSSEIAQRGIITVSGLARGIDTIVHSSTLKAGGKTIAVLGSGMDVIYPSENKKLFNQAAVRYLSLTPFSSSTFTFSYSSVSCCASGMAWPFITCFFSSFSS